MYIHKGSRSSGQTSLKVGTCSTVKKIAILQRRSKFQKKQTSKQLSREARHPLPRGGKNSKNKNSKSPVNLSNKNQHQLIKSQSSSSNNNACVYYTSYWYRTDLDVRNTESLFARGNKLKHLGCPRNGSVAKQTCKTEVVHSTTITKKHNNQIMQSKAKTGTNVHRTADLKNPTK